MPAASVNVTHSDSWFSTKETLLPVKLKQRGKFRKAFEEEIWIFDMCESRAFMWVFFSVFPKVLLGSRIFSLQQWENIARCFFRFFRFFFWQRWTKIITLKKNSIWRKYWKTSENELFPMLLALPCPYRLTSVVFRMVVHKDQSSVQSELTTAGQQTNCLFWKSVKKSHIFW